MSEASLKGGPSRGGSWPVWRAAVLPLSIFLAAPLSLTAEDRGQWQQPDRVLRDLGLKPGATVADVGCGEGYFTARLSKAVGSQGKVYAVDVDQGALAALRKRAQREHLTNVATVASEPTDTKLSGENCDVALFCNVLHEVSPGQRLPLVQDVARALRPDGFLFVIDWRDCRKVAPDSDEEGIPSRKDLVKLGADAGLSFDAEFHYLTQQVFLRFRKPVRP